MKNILINNVVEATLKYLQTMPKEKRKAIGQFFTSTETAQYMATMFDKPKKKELSILDPGAGSGILSAAIIDRLQEDDTVERIRLTCYETSEDILPILRTNLQYMKETSQKPIDYEIIEENYITSQAADFNQAMFASRNPIKYDWIIGNPPYMKIAKDSSEALAMPAVCYGAPNLYFLFAAMSLFNLDKQGEMVYIIPRSWTSGAYFKAFREYLLTEGTLRQVHLFVSRDEVFENESVLQETMIIKLDKSNNRGTVKITSTRSNKDFNNINAIDVPYNVIVYGNDKYVYLVTTEEELKVLQTLEKWKHTLPSIGLRMRTGLTVDFRSREFLRNEPGEGVVPLFYAQHIQAGRVVFPVGKEGEYITTERSGLIQRNKNYLLIKRFTSKEEKRRLQCGIYLASTQPDYNAISTDNKVNFIEGLKQDLTDEQVYGLYVLFNSTIYDQYYRILNGSTQVNSTEVNAMPVPPLKQIEQLGKELIEANDLSVETCDKILEVLINE
jgi:adenine-specific DNA-methyltransferase